MKKVMFAIVLLLSSYTFVKAQTTTVGIDCEGFSFHRPKFDCKSGFWVCLKKCKITATTGIIHVTLASKEIPPTVKALFTLKDDNTLEMRIMEDLSKNSEYEGENLDRIAVGEDESYDLPVELAEALGVKSITLLAGDFNVDKSEEWNFGIFSFAIKISK